MISKSISNIVAQNGRGFPEKIRYSRYTGLVLASNGNEVSSEDIIERARLCRSE